MRVPGVLDLLRTWKRFTNLNEAPGMFPVTSACGLNRRVNALTKLAGRNASPFSQKAESFCAESALPNDDFAGGWCTKSDAKLSKEKRAKSVTVFVGIDEDCG